MRASVADSAWLAQDRARSAVAAAFWTVVEIVRWPFDRIAWTVQRWLIWPLQDRAVGAGPASRGVAFAAVVVVAAAAGVAGLFVVAPDDGKQVASDAPAAPAPPSLAVVEAAPETSSPTLQGAAPVFAPPKGDSAAAAPVVAEASAPEETASTDASPSSSAESSTAPSSSSETSGETAAASSSAKPSGEDGPPAGPEAVAVARDFADAFVLYETGRTDADVRKVLAETATPQLTKALLRRPPRLPADMTVPKAKVLNVVPGPSEDGVYTISVSLLRVGLTSELRLDVKAMKGKRWVVSNVLG